MCYTEQPDDKQDEAGGRRMKDKSKIRRIVLRINPNCEEHVKLEDKIKNICNTMGLTNTQAVIMLLKEKSDDLSETGHKNETEFADGFLDTLSEL